jgi:hypothetical protein
MRGPIDTLIIRKLVVTGAQNSPELDKRKAPSSHRHFVRVVRRQPMPQPQTQMELWNDRAREARVQAEQAQDSIAQVMLLTISETYERLAQREKKRFAFQAIRPSN